MISIRDESFPHTYTPAQAHTIAYIHELGKGSFLVWRQTQKYIYKKNILFFLRYFLWLAQTPQIQNTIIIIVTINMNIKSNRHDASNICL